MLCVLFCGRQAFAHATQRPTTASQRISGPMDLVTDLVQLWRDQSGRADRNTGYTQQDEMEPGWMLPSRTDVQTFVDDAVVEAFEWRYDVIWSALMLCGGMLIITVACIVLDEAIVISLCSRPSPAERQVTGPSER